MSAAFELGHSFRRLLRKVRSDQVLDQADLACVTDGVKQALLKEAAYIKSYNSFTSLIKSGGQPEESLLFKLIEDHDSYCLDLWLEGRRSVEVTKLVNKIYASESPLMKAVQSFSRSSVQVLLEFGADPGQEDGSGRTPLHQACLLGDAPAFKAMARSVGFEYIRLKLESLLSAASTEDLRDYIATVAATGDATSLAES